MNSRSKLLSAVSLVALSAALSGCGDSLPTSGPSGRSVQGPVLGASVFADNVAAGIRFTKDAGEVSTTTDAVTGNFTLPSVPGYNYILVSKGGTDKLTGQPAMQMLAPAGSANITPLTSLVALDTTGTVKAKLQALMPGFSFDADISTTSSQAVLLVSKSIETMVQAMDKAIIAAAGANTISAAQSTEIEMLTLQSIAQQFALPGVTAATLSAPASLSTTLQAAAVIAASKIETADSNITITGATASALASSAVTGVADAFFIGAVATSTPIVGGETAVITPAVAGNLTTAVDSSAATAAASITATSTPTTFNPPAIPVVTPPTVATTGTTGGNPGGTGLTF